ncbi:MAG: hypothetical protein KatS3mg115_0559 [Candidatus Poribacteria bacterium]|nr:MAG: hypothetical protein KatS3mg115_0559 [Candidatus Poribacteria bacterium]
MKQLVGLRCHAGWVSHLAALQGCLRFLGINVSHPWLFGITGHAFLLIVDRRVSLRAPTDWDATPIKSLAQNLGATIRTVAGRRGEPDFPKRQEEAWRLARMAIDNAAPVYAWEMELPEYYVVYGYDEEGYYYSGAGGYQAGPKPWRTLGEGASGRLEVNAVEIGEPLAEEVAVYAGIAFALRFIDNPARWGAIGQAGVDGFDRWISALEEGTAQPFGVSYHAPFWHECRRMAAEFLRECRARLNESLRPLLNEAAGHYDVVAQNLATVHALFPFPQQEGAWGDQERVAAAIARLREAREHESIALALLREIHDQLEERVNI